MLLYEGQKVFCPKLIFTYRCLVDGHGKILVHYRMNQHSIGGLL